MRLPEIDAVFKVDRIPRVENVGADHEGLEEHRGFPLSFLDTVPSSHAFF